MAPFAGLVKVLNQDSFQDKIFSFSFVSYFHSSRLLRRSAADCLAAGYKQHLLLF
jgi:hypothetical protein